MAYRLQIALDMIAHYNAQDADAYVDLMTDDACEASYRGAVLREGKEGVRSGLKAMFAEFPENRAEVLKAYRLGDYVALHEKVWRSGTRLNRLRSCRSIRSRATSAARVEFIR